MTNQLDLSNRTIARGVAEIACVIEETSRRRTYYKLEQGHVPGAFKEGQIWCVSIPRYRRAIHGDAA